MRQHLSSLLRHRVTLQQPVMTPDGVGGYAKTWGTVATLWAQIAPMDAQTALRERFAEERQQPTALFRITLRYRAGITSDMRIVYDSRYFNIRNVTVLQEQKASLELLCEEGVAV